MLTNIEIFVINKIKELRLENGLSQAELAHKINVSNGFIGKIESMKYNSKYNLNLINRVAKAFNISPQDLLPKKYL